MPAKRSSSAPGDADKLIAHQALHSQRRRASPSTTTGWQNRAATQAGHWRTTSVPYSPWNPMPAPNPAPASASATPGSRRSKRSPTSISLPNPASTAPRSPTRSRWLARRSPHQLLGPPGTGKTHLATALGYRRSPCRAPRRIRPGHRMDHPTRRSTPHQPTRCRTTQDLPATDSS